MDAHLRVIQAPAHSDGSQSCRCCMEISSAHEAGPAPLCALASAQLNSSHSPGPQLQTRVETIWGPVLKEGGKLGPATSSLDLDNRSAVKSCWLLFHSSDSWGSATFTPALSPFVQANGQSLLSSNLNSSVLEHICVQFLLHM